MSRKNFFILAVLMVAASFLGGLVSSIIFRPLGAWAQSDLRKTIEAKAFYVIDEKGKHRAILATANGVPCLTFLNEEGIAEIFMVLAQQGPGVDFYDTKDTLRMNLQVQENGAAGLNIRGIDGKPRAKILVENDDTPKQNGTKLRFHDLRHVTASWLNQRGSPWTCSGMFSIMRTEVRQTGTQAWINWPLVK